MKNLFREILLTPPKPKIKITFNSSKEYKDFIEALSNTDNSKFKLLNYKSVSYYLNDNEIERIDSNSKQEIHVDKSFMQEVVIDKKKNLRLKIYINYSGLIETDPKRCIILKIKRKDDITAEISFKSDFSKAENLEQIFNDIDLLQKFIEVFVKPEDLSKSLSLYELLNYWNNFFNRVKELEKFIGVPFDVSKIADIHIFEKKINILYVSLIKQELIKETRRLKQLSNLTVNKSDSILSKWKKSAKEDVNLDMIADEKFEILGITLNLYKVIHIMHVKISNMKSIDGGGFEIQFKQPDKEYAPLCVYKLFIDKEKAKVELNNYDVTKVLNAKTLNEYISKL